MAVAGLLFPLTNYAVVIPIAVPLPKPSSPSDGCVSGNYKVGDTMRSDSGNILTIKSLFGTNFHCKEVDKPILATVEFTASPSFTPQAKIPLPDGFIEKPFGEMRKFNGEILFAHNDDLNEGFIVTSNKNDGVLNPLAFTVNLKKQQALKMNNVEQTEIEQFTINGLPALRFEKTGDQKISLAPDTPF